MLSPTTNTVVDYRWQNGDRTPTFTASDTGRYFLTVSNECGIASKGINILPGVCRLYIPTAFTPNGDNLNDVFRIKQHFPVKMFNMRIFSRYGEIIFDSNSMQAGWDGIYKGQKLPSGNYVWIVSVEYNDNRIENLRGTVMLMR
jgi:gliding motility-associated-like protein